MQPETGMLQGTIEEAAHLIAGCLTGRYVSILLVGSAARGEITIDSNGHILSDLDFLVVLPHTSMMTALFEMRHCRSQLRNLNSLFTSSPFPHVSVGLAPAVRRYWDMATPLMWELRTTARVFHGSPEVLEWPTMRAARQIPSWEGIRLIANRMCELIAAVGRSETWRSTAPDRAVAYACIKLTLACSEATLISAGLYTATYRQRRRHHAEIAGCFTSSQNAAIDLAYRLKAGEHPHWPRSTGSFIRETLRMSLDTLARLDITAPEHFARCLAEQSRTAPGPISHALFWAAQSLHLRRVPFRHAITGVYADAYHIIDGCVTTSVLPASRCSRVASGYDSCPQVVSMVSVPGQVQLKVVTGA